jgi:hypothetical protein
LATKFKEFHRENHLALKTEKEFRELDKKEALQDQQIAFLTS